MDSFLKHFLIEFRLPLTNPVLVFSLILFIILLSPIVLRKLRIPGIIGLIFSGILIGPKGLGIIGQNSIAAEGWIKLFSTIGILYIMFMAGLDLDLNQFKRYYKKSVVFGAMTFFIPLLLGFPICYYGLNLSPLASLLTASMFSTHTLVAYPIISKFGLTKHHSVAISVGGTILTDTAVLIILAIISSASNGELDWAFWIRLITSLFFFSLIMFYVLPKVTRWFLKKLDTEKTSQYILILSVVFFSAFLAEVAGVEHIIGAFVAGLVLNRLIPHNSILMNRIDFIGNALFIPSFLIFVGMVVDYRALFQGYWPLVIAVVLTSFAIFSKWLAAFVTQVIYRMTATERRMIFGLSTSHAAATLAIIMVGFQDKILDINVVNGTILLILITCMVASFVTENAGKEMLLKLADIGEDDGLESKLRNKHVVVAMNSLAGNEKLLEFALQVSDPKVINPISIVSVLPNSRQAEQIIHKSRKNLEEIVKHFSGYETKLNTIATIDLNVSSGISRVAVELVADAVIVNDSSKPNLLKMLVGNDREHLLESCDKTIFFCQIEKPSVDYHQMVIFAPEYAELESYFISWAERVLRYANELKLEIQAYMTENCYERLIRVGQVNKINASVTWHHFEPTEDVLPSLQSEDLLCIVSSRVGSISYKPELESMASRMLKGNQNNDWLLIYPGQDMDLSYRNYEDVSSAPIGVGVGTLSRIGKEVGSIFKKEE
ncbi:MAG: cation:proton antiporter [Flavobacteriia bacterium]|nr:cation:proton antiporter [Flavobacteriia bacterium]